MDDWLSARFNGHVPPTPTGSMGGDLVNFVKFFRDLVTGEFEHHHEMFQYLCQN